MILINLLPHRETARKQKREIFFATMGLAALVGILICVIVYSWVMAQIESQRGKNTFLKAEVASLDVQIKEIATLQAEITALRARQNAVEDLQGNRNLPVDLLSELVKQLPDGVYINSMKQDNQTVTIAGVAQSNERVSELLRNFSNNSPWLTKPELVEITASTLTLSPRDLRRVSNFSIRVALKRSTGLIAGGSVAAGASTASPVSSATLPTQLPIQPPAATVSVPAKQ